MHFIDQISIVNAGSMSIVEMLNRLDLDLMLLK
jgi:hypothetical protein